MFNVDPNRPTAEILAGIKAAGQQGVNQPSIAVSLIMPPLAALLVRLSNDAAATADKNLLIQKRLIRLTWAMVILSVAVLAVSIVLLVHEW